MKKEISWYSLISWAMLWSWDCGDATCPCSLICVEYLSQHMAKPTIKCEPAKTQISLCTHTVWLVFTDHMSLLQPPGYQKRDTQDPCHTEWMYRLIWVFAGHIGLIVTQVLSCAGSYIWAVTWENVSSTFRQQRLISLLIHAVWSVLCN